MMSLVLSLLFICKKPLLSLTLGEIILDSRAYLVWGYKLLHSIYGNKDDRRTADTVLRSSLQ